MRMLTRYSQFSMSESKCLTDAQNSLLEQSSEQQRIEASHTGLSDGLHDLIAVDVVLRKISSCRPLPLIIPFRYLTKAEQTILKEAQVLSANEADMSGRYHFSEEESDKLPIGATIFSNDESYDRLVITDSKLVKCASRLQTLCVKTAWPRRVVNKEQRLKAQSVAHRALIEFWKLLRQTRLDQLEYVDRIHSSNWSIAFPGAI